MTIQEQISELEKVILVLVKSKSGRLKSGNYTEGELDYQIECCRAAVNSLKNLDKMKQEVDKCLETLRSFEFGLIQ